ncbi:phage tail sheath family protein [Herbidospora galbida]|uniref:Phage tail sheath family protein n=1 Tax=Herbidospora galbida TaxID=2575442 RepID=A0A4U3MKU3_9ACTN|nr:phage tail sheath subtilisin-like domain-containing protein [Herbidospora galbida]TKK89550.1 phage tail sheath family protein [Herbidospora galbida]
MPDYRAPGVYVEELSAAGPVSGVGTSTAAFIGPALRGPTGQPTKITNWTQFTAQFGDYINAPRRYLAHAVRGFFDNGGGVAYVTRVGTATRAALELKDRGNPAATALVVRAREDGPAGNAIKVAVRAAQVVPDAKVLQVKVEGASATGDVVTLPTADDARKFAPGDLVDVGGTVAEVSRVRGRELVLTAPLAAPVDNKPVRTADLRPGQRRFRVDKPKGIERGTVLTLKHEAVTETVIVERVSGDTVEIGGALTGTYAAPPAVTSSEFSLDVVAPNGVLTAFDNLSMDPRHSRHFAGVVASPLVDVELPAEPGLQAPPANLPVAKAATALAGGTADRPDGVDATSYERALAALERVGDVTIVCVPDAVTLPGVQQKVVEHCEKMGDRFAVLDAPDAASPLAAGGVLDRRELLTSDRGYAAVYYPWLVIADPAGRGTLAVPPSGHLAGVYARSDARQGVHKAPANETVTGASGVTRALDVAEQGELNDAGVNVIQTFAGNARPVVWGARTTAPRHETAWRYINVRRLFLFLEESLREGLRWVVFQPNDLSLRKRVERTVGEFLTRVWTDGALFGATADEAFYVKVDDENNPAEVRDLGRLVVDIGVAPVRPAEFVVIRIGMSQGGSQVREG